jgi:Domain of unknown function (DUF5615)
VDSLSSALEVQDRRSLPLEAASTLREYGFDAGTVWDESLCGADDQTIADRVRGEGRILLTLDLDFANIRAYPPDQHPGIIVPRLKGQDKDGGYVHSTGRGRFEGPKPGARALGR